MIFASKAKLTSHRLNGSADLPMNEQMGKQMHKDSKSTSKQMQVDVA